MKYDANQGTCAILKQKYRGKKNLKLREKTEIT